MAALQVADRKSAVRVTFEVVNQADRSRNKQPGTCSNCNGTSRACARLWVPRNTVTYSPFRAELNRAETQDYSRLKGSGVSLDRLYTYAELSVV